MEADERARAAEGTRDDSRSPVVEAAGDRTAAPEIDGQTPLPHGRCIHHPSRAAVATCSACDEPVCLACAVPVRGRVLGRECVAAELGDPALVVPSVPAGPSLGSWAAVAGAVAALIGTVGPWTRTGAGDRVFGAWVPVIRWSMLAAFAAGALLVTAWWLHARDPRDGSRWMVVLLGLVVLTASALAIAFPPTFQAASWGPWVTGAGGAIAAGVVAANSLVGRDPRQGV